jgi:eukaryotic-like serine/threonine-protein kinase
LKPERWKRVREVFDGALEVTPDERRAFLDSACGSDAELRQEVESLLRSDEGAGAFLQSQAENSGGNQGKMAAEDPWIGRQIGQYRIAERVGIGGMGVVYRAEDLRLGRSAALKFLTAEIERDARARERFEREARAASALNHPNICTIYGVDEVEGRLYLAMEMLKGRTLGEVIQGRPVAIDRVLELSIAIASALEAAHAEGIVHRDLKPGNIFVTDKDQVKILDFGLAKQSALDPLHSDPNDSPETVGLTTAGMIIGTISYMSPEQIRAERLDARSDLFSFGAVLYEMATGQQAFPGKLPVLVLDAILNRFPLPPSEANPLLPQRVSGIISKALQKDRMLRYQTAAEMLHDLREAQRGETVTLAHPQSRNHAPRPARQWIAALLLLIVVAGAAGLYWLKRRSGSSIFSRSAEHDVQLVARPSIAVLGFDNLTGKPEHEWLSTAFSEMLSTELAAGGRMRVVTGEDVARARKDLGLTDGQTYSKQTLDRLRKNLGVDYVVTGSYLDTGPEAGGQLRLDARLQDARTGETIASLPETGSESKLIDMLSHTGASLRAKLGIGGIAGTEITKVAATIPKDPAAARLYAEGLARLRELDPGGARDTLLKAVAAEPDHPLIHAALAEAWSQLGYDQKSQSEARQAASLAGQLPQSEQLWVEGRFRESTHDWDKAIEIYKTLIGFYPDNIEYGLSLAAVQTSAGRQKDAIETIASMRKLQPPASTDPRIDLAEANALDVAADFKRETEVAHRAYDEARNRGARLLAAKAQNAMAWAALNMGDMAAAAKLADEARSVYVAAGDRNGESSQLRTLGTVHLMQGDLAVAMKYYEDSLRLAVQVGNRYSEGAALNQIASIFERQGKHAEALDRYQKTLAIMREVGNKYAEAILLNNIANILWSRGELGPARSMYEQAVTIARQLNDRGGDAGGMVNIAHIFFQQGDLKGSEKNLQQALAIVKEIGERSIQGEITNSLGDIRLAQANLSDARDKFSEAISLREGLSDQLGLGETRTSLSELYLAQSKPGEAEKTIDAAVDEFHKADSQDQEITAVGIQARVLMALNKPAEALKAINRVREKALRVENPYVRLGFVVDAAEVDAFSGKTAEARAMLEKAHEEADRHGFLPVQLRIRLALGQIERKKGNSTKGNGLLLAVQKEATARGFLLIAQEATSLQGK